VAAELPSLMVILVPASNAAIWVTGLGSAQTTRIQITNVVLIMSLSCLTVFNVTIRPIEVPPLLGMTIILLVILLGMLAMTIILQLHLREKPGDLPLQQETTENILKLLLARGNMTITDVEPLLTEIDMALHRSQITVVGSHPQLNLLTEVMVRPHPRPLLHLTTIAMTEDRMIGTPPIRLLGGVPERLPGRVTTTSERDILQETTTRTFVDVLLRLLLRVIRITFGLLLLNLLRQGIDEGQRAHPRVLQWPTIKDIQMVTRDVLLRKFIVVVTLVTTPLPVAEGNPWTFTATIVDLKILAFVLMLGSESLKEAIRYSDTSL